MKRGFIIVCIFIAILVMCGCAASNQNALPSSKYVALYVEADDTGQVVSGGLPPIVGDAYPPIQFYYNKSAYNPSGGFPYPTNASLKILFGMYTQQSSVAGLRNGLNVVEICDFPNTPEQGLTVIGVDKNGTVKMTYNNESIDLPSGSTWTAPPIPEWNETYTVAVLPADTNGQGNGTNYTYTIQYNRTMTIENKGIFDK